VDFDDFFRTSTSHAPYSYQRELAHVDEWPDLLEAPTGSGKTAAAVLAWLWRRRHGSSAQRAGLGRRLVFCLPMRTLVEQTYRAVTQWRDQLGISEHELRVHALLGGAVDKDWDEWPDAEMVIVGTQDQLLSRALMRGYAMSRFRWPMTFALLHNDCTWVMDEVQLMGVGASTAAQLQAFRERLGTAGPTRTLWMTATLDEDRLRTVDVARPYTRHGVTSDESALRVRYEAPKTLSRSAVTVEKGGSHIASLAREIQSGHQSETLTLVVVNRVARAQHLYRHLRSLMPDVPVALVHSRFRPVERRRIEALVLSGAFTGVLIATQAIEAGVDISARTLFTELAPWSSLVQRFGRLNRTGGPEAQAVWIDVDTRDREACHPYDPILLDRARERLQDLRDVSPKSLASIPADHARPATPVLRRKDLLELFDTSPDLAGHDIDVSMYIRAANDRDVQVAWRELAGAAPDEDAGDLHRDELCAVPIDRLKKLASGGGSIWRLDAANDGWVKVDPPRLYPGLAVMVDMSVGGYSELLGFTGDRADRPSPVPAAGPPERTDDEVLTATGQFVSLAVHTDDVFTQMDVLLSALGSTITAREAEELAAAARWHDYGKAHPAFQQMLTRHLPATDPRCFGGPWAKGESTRNRHVRRFFRHELASALAWLADGGSSLAAFVIAAHHGKVRMSIRSRPGEPGPGDAGGRFAHGVWEGDLLPGVDLGGGTATTEHRLSLACMDLGGDVDSWADLMQQLLEEQGPFKLAWLETLLRVADWRGTRMRTEVAAAIGV
jgi:CRISPR-associated endonuclease/helicase Cas3